MSLHSIMTHQVTTIHLDETLATLQGILSWRDIMRAIEAQQARKLAVKTSG